jgi:hypothetical protein
MEEGAEDGSKEEEEFVDPFGGFRTGSFSKLCTGNNF